MHDVTCVSVSLFFFLMSLESCGTTAGDEQPGVEEDDSGQSERSDERADGAL